MANSSSSVIKHDYTQYETYPFKATPWLDRAVGGVSHNPPIQGLGRAFTGGGRAAYREMYPVLPPAEPALPTSSAGGFSGPPPRGPALSARWAEGGATPPVFPEFDSESGLRLPALIPQRAMGGDQYAAIPAAPLPRGDGYSAGGSNHLVASSPPLPPLTRSEMWYGGSSPA